MALRRSPSHRSLTALVDDLQARGRYTFTREEASSRGRRSGAGLRSAVRRLKGRGRIASPRRGFHVVVPVEYRSAGAPPASWFVDDLMKFLRQPYYVGLLSAAAIHGAAHQQPMAFQVVTDRPTRSARIGRVRFEFHMRRDFGAAATTTTRTETGSMRVATPEMTAFDLLRFVGAAGHLDNVATVLAELAEKIDPDRLVKLAERASLAEVQRLGYVLEAVGAGDVAEPLSQWFESQRRRPVLLAPGRPRGKSSADPRWRVISNVRIDVDR